ncbi:MAG: hypothetical protein J5494_06440, partial [Candidatus Methanomethylophilaceae archaeon]|nr:hypothetical protein [Candidatus Methanomethylophilaceae archaeon]
MDEVRPKSWASQVKVAFRGCFSKGGAAILYFCLPQGRLQKHQGNASCDFEDVFISAQTFDTGLLPLSSHRTWFDVFGEHGIFLQNTLYASVSTLS